MTDEIDENFFESEEKPKNEYDPMPPKRKNEVASPMPPPTSPRKRNRLTCGCITCLVTIALACCVLPVIAGGVVVGLVAVACSFCVDNNELE